MSLSSILLFVFILLVLVIIHELGHFIAAKVTGMRVDEFAFGFPPRLFAIKKGETTYAVNALPLGGYVSIFGENGQDNDPAVKDSRAFGNRPWWAQLIVLVAGVTMNMILAWIVFIGISYGTIAVSVDDPTYGAKASNFKIVVLEATQESPAYRAGIIPGSIITSIKSRGADAALTSATSAVTFIANHQNDELHITYITPQGQSAETTIAAVYGIVPEKKAIGVMLDMQGTYTTSMREALVLGTKQTYFLTKETLKGLWSLLEAIPAGENVISSLSGPVGIAKVVNTTSEYGSRAILALTALLSINLAVLNLLPLPALDGGRMLVVIGEKLSRRKLPTRYLMIMNSVGFSLLALLIIVVTIKDIFY